MQANLKLSVQRAGTKVIAIGASTGGPPVLKAILRELPRSFPIPILVVQHITPGFLPGMLEWMGKECRLELVIAEHGQRIRPGMVYFAPDGSHMEFLWNGIVSLEDMPPEHGVKPSVSVLFRSLAVTYGGDVVGILLTGMGRDGALELLHLRQLGALTLVQDRESCVVFGMPGEAVRLGAASAIETPGGIAQVLVKIATMVSRENPHGRED